MFKQKKINENAVKKDFYKKICKTSIIDLQLKQEISKTSYFIVNKLKEIVSLPEKNEEYKILTKKNNSSIDILENIKVDELIIVCSRIDIKSIEKVSNIKNKKIFVSDVIKNIKAEIFKVVKKEFNQVVVEKNHAKMLLFRSGFNYYICDCSGNPSINARNEFYNIVNCEKSYKEIKKCLQIED